MPCRRLAAGHIAVTPSSLQAYSLPIVLLGSRHVVLESNDEATKGTCLPPAACRAQPAASWLLRVPAACCLLQAFIAHMCMHIFLPAVLDLGADPRLLYLAAGSTMSFNRIRLQGGWAGRRDGVRSSWPWRIRPTATATALVKGRWLAAWTCHPRPVRPSPCVCPAGAAPPSSAVANRSTIVVGSPVWPTVDGEPGHQLRFFNSSLLVGCTNWVFLWVFLWVFSGADERGVKLRCRRGRRICEGACPSSI